MGGGAMSCRFGCMAVGGDDIRYYMTCPAMCGYACRSRAATSCWAEAGQLRLALRVLPTMRRQAHVSALWTCVVYALYCTTRARPRPSGPEEFRMAARAAIRSLCTRAPLVHRILYGDARAVPRPRRPRGILGLGEDAPAD